MLYYAHIKENQIEGYYCKEFHGDIPKNSIAITEELWRHLLNENKIIVNIEELGKVISPLDSEESILDITYKEYFHIKDYSTDEPELNQEPDLLERIEILEEENAQLLIDSAVKDIKINSLESDVADILIELVNRRSVN